MLNPGLKTENPGVNYEKNQLVAKNLGVADPVHKDKSVKGSQLRPQPPFLSPDNGPPASYKASHKLW